VLLAAENDYYASHSWNPFFFHGTKTFAYEVCEQLGWQAPDEVVLPVGNGTLLLGAALGFRELFEMGVIGKLPRLVGVQAEACAPLAEAFNFGATHAVFEKRETLAEGIAIAEPVRREQILAAVRQSGGTFTTVSEGEIRASLLAMCRQGFYIEPTAAATIAGVEKTTRSSQAHIIVTVLTGHGLKATEKMLKL
jgi:threonine synthase